MFKMRNFYKKILIAFTLAFSLGASLAFGQVPAPKPKPETPRTPETKPKIAVPRFPETSKPGWKIARKAQNESEMPAEKSIAVDANVNISLCISEGNLKVNGWDRSEIRAFVSEGSQVGFSVLQKSRQSANPVWVKILGFDPATNKEMNLDECLSGDEIELDVPRGATVNIKSRESETTIDSIAKVSVENIGGDIFLNNIARGIEAKTYRGGVTVKNSSGAMALFSTNGNIVAFDVSPSEIGDIFKARTSNGAVALKNVGHRQIEAGSNSGSINYIGEFLNGGQYNFGTSNGSIVLTIPQSSSIQIYASYGYGAFQSEIPLQNIEKNTPSKVQSLSAQIGSGDAALKLTTVSGAIRIRKQ